MSEELESCPVCGALPCDQVDTHAVRELVRNRYKLSRQEILDDCASPTPPTTEGREDLDEHIGALLRIYEDAHVPDAKDRARVLEIATAFGERCLAAALSPPDGDGKQEQARPSGSAPISHGNEGHDQ